jgi:glycopeptide antibiotics resistance protein
MNQRIFLNAFLLATLIRFLLMDWILDLLFGPRLMQDVAYVPMALSLVLAFPFYIIGRISVQKIQRFELGHLVMESAKSFYLVLIFIVLFTSRRSHQPSLGLIPFRSFQEFFSHPQSFMAIYFLFGNLILFIPLGAWIYLRARYRKEAVFMTVLGFFILEILQYRLGVGTFDIDDVILYVGGLVLGFVLGAVAKKYRKVVPDEEIF